MKYSVEVTIEFAVDVEADSFQEAETKVKKQIEPTVEKSDITYEAFGDST